MEWRLLAGVPRYEVARTHMTHVTHMIAVRRREDRYLD